MRKKKKNSTKKEDVFFDLPLFAALQPQGGITFKEPNYIITGDGYAKIIHIYGLPTKIKDYWLSSLTQQTDCITTLDIMTRDTAEVQKNINSAIKEERGRELSAGGDYQTIYSSQQRQIMLQSLYDEITSMGEVVKMVHIRLYVSGRSLVMLEEKVGQIMKFLEGNEFKPTVLLNEGEREWKALFQPYEIQAREPFTMKGLTLMSEQIAGGYPFNFSYLKDEGGDLLGFTNNNGVVVFNEFTKTEKRKHYNSVVIGDMGSGKSTLLKKRFAYHAALGNYIRCFDVSGEFTGLTKEFGGRVIKCDSDSSMLNPLEIMKAADDERTSFSIHISKVCTFYQCLVPSVTDELMIKLQNLLHDFYESIDLTPKPGRSVIGLPAGQYPTFTEFCTFVKKSIQEKEDSALGENEVKRVLLIKVIEQEQQIYEALSSMIKSYGQMFDGHTTISNLVDEKIVTFNISNIKDMDKRVFAAQLFNMMYFCWDNCIGNGQMMKELYERGELAFEDVERFLILIDESHRWVNTQFPFILERVAVLMREARKYFGGISLASQSFRDYAPDGTSDQAMERLKVIFELTQYKFIFKQDTSVLPLIDKLFGKIVTPWQRDKIPYLSMGETVLVISGDRNLFFKVWLSERYEKNLFAGGA